MHELASTLYGPSGDGWALLTSMLPTTLPQEKVSGMLSPTFEGSSDSSGLNVTDEQLLFESHVSLPVTGTSRVWAVTANGPPASVRAKLGAFAPVRLRPLHEPGTMM